MRKMKYKISLPDTELRLMYEKLKALSDENIDLDVATNDSMIVENVIRQEPDLGSETFTNLTEIILILGSSGAIAAVANVLKTHILSKTGKIVLTRSKDGESLEFEGKITKENIERIDEFLNIKTKSKDQLD